MFRTFLLLALAGLMSACTTPPPRAASLLQPSDRQVIAATTAEALETSRSGESRNWENPETGLTGHSTPLNSDGGEPNRPCRDFRQTLGHNGSTTTAYDRACRGEDGAWISLNHPDLAGAISRARLYETNYPPPTYGHGVVLVPSVTYGFYGHHGGHHGGYYRHRYPYYFGHYGFRHGLGHHRFGHHRYGHHRHGHHRKHRGKHHRRRH